MWALQFCTTVKKYLKKKEACISKKCKFDQFDFQYMYKNRN